LPQDKMGIIGPFGFTGGMNSSTSIYTQPPNTLRTSQDLRVISGSLVERFGTSTLVASIKGSGNLFVQGVIPNILTPTTYPCLVIQDGKIYGISSTGVVTDITGTSTLSGGTENQINNADILNGTMIISDAQGASGSMVKWSGSGNCSNLGTGPDGISVRVVNNFMFSFPSASSNVYWSNIADPLTWTAANFISFRAGDGDVISAIHYIGTNLYVFKKYSIGSLATQTVVIAGAVTLGPLVTVNIGVGCSGSGAVDKLPDGRLVFFGSDSHVYIFDGNTLNDISDQPHPGSNAQSFFDSCAPSTQGNLTRVTVYPPRNEVWCSMTINPVSSGNPMDRAMVWNWKNNTWTGPFTFPGANRHLSGIAWVPSLNGALGGLSGGGVFNAEGNLVTAYRDVVSVQDVTNSVAGSPAPQWSVSILLSGEGRSFIPRSLLLFHKGTSVSSTFAVTYGYDGGSLGHSNTVTTSTSYIRTTIPLVIPSTGQSSVGPSSIQIQISDTNGGGVIFDPIYLSDEVLV